MAIAWMLNFGGWNYIYYVNFLASSFEISLISLLVVLAAITKSAQIPFSSWLPAAMAAKTPVSFLVHSSTLLTAGVYLLIRFSPALNRFLCTFLLLLSSLTIFMAGINREERYSARPPL
jgi:NADH-ubiquinone oxidoreductase chain 5